MKVASTANYVMRDGEGAGEFLCMPCFFSVLLFLAHLADAIGLSLQLIQMPPADFKTYLQSYPDGAFAPLAQASALR
jgi:hypothetical protein